MTGFWSAGLFADPLEVTTTLNGGSATLIAYEDTNNDGVADNTEEVTLLDGSNGYDLPSFALGSGNDYWWFLETGPSGVTSRVEVTEVAINP